METTFKIGDTAWLASYRQSDHWIPCPDCAGSGALTVILGDESRVSVECSCRGPDYGNRAGTVVTYDHEAFAEKIVIEGMEIVSGKETNYKYNVTSCSWRSADAGDLFAGEEGAMARALEKKAEHEAAEVNRLAGKEKDTRTWAWHVTYHRKELKRAIHNVEYHTAKLNVAKLKAKEPQPA